MKHKNQRNNHGSNATIGDYVRLLNAQGRNTDIYGIVYDIETKSSPIGPKRFLWVHGQPAPIFDHLANIVSRHEEDIKSDMDVFGSDLADI